MQELECQELWYLGSHPCNSILQDTMLGSYRLGEFTFKSLQYGQKHETQDIRKLNGNTGFK